MSINLKLNKIFKERSLEISAEKPTATVFITFINECITSLPISIKSKTVLTVKHPKIHGAQRVATGCVKMTPTSQINQENNILPVKKHNHMLTDQYLLSMHLQVHSNHHLLSAPTQPIKMRETILHNFPNLSLRDDILNTRPPAKEERTLPRKTSGTLAQHRSGYTAHTCSPI